jgi:UDP-2,3-diacylglucosamine hydrolase
MELAPDKKIYFLSDFHLGAPNELESRKREDRLVRFFNETKKDAAAYFIVGDIFGLNIKPWFLKALCVF